MYMSGFLLLVASHGLQNPWCNESSGGIPWCNESSSVIFDNPLDAILIKSASQPATEQIWQCATFIGYRYRLCPSKNDLFLHYKN